MDPALGSERGSFPGYPGINTALGVYGLNTTGYANGLHTIAWVVTDNGGVTSGIGSRFFSVFNAGAAQADATMRPIGPDLGRRVSDLSDRTSSDPILMRAGFNLRRPTDAVPVGFSGRRYVRAMERDRVEIRLARSGGAARDGEYAGYLLMNGQLRELPKGSSFDPDRGAFYWQPGLGYIGDYDFLFVRTLADGSRERIPVRVTLEPRTFTRMASARSPWSGIDFLR